MSGRPTARCPLCQQIRVLCDSHLIAAGFSRHLRDPNTDGRNPNPYKITWGQKLQTSRQLKAYCLCEECEQLLESEGEEWVIEHCAQPDNTFPLRSLLEKTVPIEKDPDFVLYSTDSSEVDVRGLCHFAAGVFWRAAVCRFSDTKDLTPLLGLGKKYAEQFRQFLLGQATFPDNTALCVEISTRPAVLLTTGTPITLEERPIYHHFFQVPGVGFRLFVGSGVPASNLRKCCLLRGPRHPIIGSSVLDKESAAAQYLGPRKVSLLDVDAH